MALTFEGILPLRNIVLSKVSLAFGLVRFYNLIFGGIVPIRNKSGRTNERGETSNPNCHTLYLLRHRIIRGLPTPSLFDLPSSENLASMQSADGTSS